MSTLYESKGIPHVTRISTYLTTLPILILNVHSRCNCRCVMCDIWKRETSTEIKVANLERHRLSLHKLGTRQVVLSGGEPLLHSDLKSLCSFFRQEQIHLTLLTTGLLLLKRAEEVSKLFDEIIISIDGPAEVHDAVRRVKGAFQLIQNGIAAIRRYRPDMPVRGRSTVQKANHLCLRGTVAAAKLLALDSISFLAADLTSEAFNRPLLWPVERQSEIALSHEEVGALENEIEELIAAHAEDIRTNYIAESISKLRGITRHYRVHLGQFVAESPTCNAPWVSAVVEANGSVRPCFFHPVIGNIYSSTLEEVLNGEVASTFRESLDIPSNPTCQRCVCSLNYNSSKNENSENS